MEKLYSVVVKKGVDLEQLDKELAASTGEGNIPNRPVSIGNPLVGNNRTTQWMLTQQEAETLKQDERVVDVFLPPFEHYTILGSGSSTGKMIRYVRAASQDIDSLTQDTVDLDVEALNKANHYANGWDSKIVNWALGRHQSFTDDHLEFTNEFFEQSGNGRDDWLRKGGVGSVPRTPVVTLAGTYGDSYEYGFDGEDVDIVIMDTGINPENPEWEDQNGQSRLQQIDWAQIATDNGYQLVEDDGSPLVQHPRHYEDFDGHGTHCASIAAGKSNGFAKGAHIYAFRLRDIAGDGTNEQGYSWLQALTLLKIWHENKGTGRPTILNMSLGVNKRITSNPNFIEYRGEFINAHPYTTRDRVVDGNTVIDPATGEPEQVWDITDSNTHLVTSNEFAVKHGLKRQVLYANGATGYDINARDAAIDAAVEDLIDVGIHIVCAAGNNGFKLDIDSDNPDYVMRNQQVDQTNVGADWNNKIYLFDSSEDKWIPEHYHQPPTPAGSHPDVCVVGNLSNEKFADPELDFTDGLGALYSSEGGSLSLSTTNIRNKHEVKAASSAWGNGIDMWAAGSEILAGNPMRTLFNKNCDINVGFVYGENQYTYANSPAFQPIEWARDVHLHQLDDKEGYNGLIMEHDTTSISGKVRTYIKLDPDFVDTLLSKGIDKIRSIRTYLHYDHLDPEWENFHNIFTTAERDALGNLNSGIEYSTQYNYLTSAQESLYGANTKYTITSHDIDYGHDPVNSTDVRASSGTSRLMYDDTGAQTSRAKKASKFLAFVEKGCMFLQTVYEEYEPQYRDWAGEPIDLNDPNVTDRILFEITVPSDEFTSNPAFWFRCGGVILNVLHDVEVIDSRYTYGVKAFTEHFTGSALQTLSGTSMSAPAVAGMMATHIEKDGNKTQKEMIDLMSSPYSRKNRASLTEAAQVGFDMRNLVIEDFDEDQNGVYARQVDPNSFYVPNDVNLSTSYITNPLMPHNRFIAGNKTIAAPAHVDRAAPQFTVTGEVTHYSGTYEDWSTITADFPTDLSAIPPIAPLSYVNIASDETWNIDLEVYGETTENQQDGDWIPKQLHTDYGSLSDLSKIEDGLYRATFTNNFGLTGNHIPTVTFSGTMLKPIQDTATKGLLPTRPSFVSDYSSIVVTEDDNLTDALLFTPQVTVNSPSHTIVIKNELDHDSFYVHTDGKTIYKSVALDYEEYDNDNPLQFTMYARDGWGQKSDDVTVSIVVLDSQDEPPSISQFTPSDDVSLANDYTFNVDEHLDVNNLFTISVTDDDNVDSEVTVKLKIFAHAVMTNIDGSTSNVVYDDTFDMSQLGFTFDKSDYSNITLSLDEVDYEALPTGWNSVTKYISGAIEVEDAQGHTATKPFVIQINDITEPTPALVSNTHTETDYSEFNTENSVVHTIQLTDQGDAPYSFMVDTNNHLVQMKSSSEYDVGYDNDYLSVNSQGQIYVNKALDYETADYGFLAVKVMNRYGNVAYHYTHLHLKDEEDQPAQFVDTYGSVINQDTATWIEHPAIGTQLYSFQTDLEATFTVDKGEVQDGNGNVLTGAATSGVIVSDDRWDWRDYTTDTMTITATTAHGSTDLVVDPVVTQDSSLTALEVVQNFSNTSDPRTFEVEHGTPSGTKLFQFSMNQTAYVADGTRLSENNQRWNTGDFYWVLPAGISAVTYNDIITPSQQMRDGLNVIGLEFDMATGDIYLASNADINVRDKFEFDIKAYDNLTGVEAGNARIIIEVVETDTDGDGTSDYFDAFPNDPSEDTDTDGDGVGDNADAFPNDPSESADTDGDGVGDNTDAFPNDASETVDTDGDGVGDNADAFPNDPNESADTDGDGVGDNADAFPNDPNETVDTDGDGVGDNSDAFPNDASESADTDGDGVGDNADAFPNDASESVDADGDGVGANTDFDDNDPSVGIATNLVNSFASIHVPVVAQNAPFIVTRVPFDIGTASSRRLYLASNITAATSYYQDVCVGGVQIQDQNGNVLHNIIASQYMSNYYWETADQQAGNVSTPSSVASFVPFGGVAMSGISNKWNLLSQTSSAYTGANDGISSTAMNTPWTSGQTLAQSSGAYYLYRETSASSQTPLTGYNYARSTSSYSVPAKGYIAVAHHLATHSSQLSSYNPNDALYVGLY